MKAEWKSILDEVKRIATAFKKEPEKFATATLEDGTVVEWEGELAVGTELFVVDGETRVPAPVGTHTTTEGLQVVVEEVGIVSAIVEPAPKEPEEMTYEKVAGLMNGKFADVEQMAAVLKWIFNDMYGWRLREEQSKKEWDTVYQAVQAFEKVPTVFEELVAENEELKTRLEKLENSPSFKTVEKTKFTKDSNLTARQQFLMNNLKK